MSPDDDEALVRRAAAGDEPAFGRLMRRYKDPLYRLLRRLTGDPELAYDLLQETFVAAWRNLHRFEAGLPFLPWARRIALNKVRDDARRRSVRRMLLGEAPAALVRNIADPAPLPEAQAINGEALVRLDRAIAALPLALRGPLVLTAIEGLSHAEAGAELGISAKAVETKVARARRELREILGVA